MFPGTERVRRRERGFALILTLLALVLAGTALFLSMATSPAGIEAQQAVDRAQAAEAGRAALFGYAVSGGNGTPGALPCPDLDNNGRIGEGTMFNMACQADADVWIGRLPHRSLGLARADMPGGYALWYALDPDFLDWQSDVNPGTEPTLEIEGMTRRFPAVLILPGDAVVPFGSEEAQQRPSAQTGDYLEGVNVQSPETRFASCDTDRCNDTVIGVTAESLLAIVRRRALVEIGEALRDYRDDADAALPHFPPAGDLSNDDDPPVCKDDNWSGLLPGEEHPDDNVWSLCGPDPHLPPWLATNGWNQHVFYKVAEGCRESAAACASAGDSELLSLDGEDGQAVVFGIPEEMATVDPDASAYANPDGDGDEVDRFHAIPAVETEN